MDRPMMISQPSSMLSPHTSQGLSLGSRKLSGNSGETPGTKMLRNQRQTRKVWEQQGQRQKTLPARVTHPSLSLNMTSLTHQAPEAFQLQDLVHCHPLLPVPGPMAGEGASYLPRTDKPHLGVAHLKHRPLPNPVSLRLLSNNNTG